MPASTKKGPVLHIRYRGTNIGWNADMTKIAIGIPKKARPITASTAGSVFNLHAPNNANITTPAPNPGSGVGRSTNVMRSDILNK
jgi:hypothetical protein